MATKELPILKKFLDTIKNDPVVKKDLYPHTWLSGSSTYVTPITIWRDDDTLISNQIVLQWNTDKKPTKWISQIEKFGKKLGFIRHAVWSKSDGSCPSTITFYFYNFKSLWDELTDVITDENDCIESAWHIFPAGTSKFDIWKWFEEEYGVCIGNILYA